MRTQIGCNWVVDRVVGMKIVIANFQPFAGRSYIELPKYIRNNKACINVKNKDNDCFRWALRSALFPCHNHTDRPLSYPLEDGLNFDGIDAPTPLNQIGKVEKQNNLAI